MKQASNSDVVSIDVEMDRPKDRGAKRDDVRTNSASQSISGSGGSGVLQTNNSAGDWYVDTISATCPGASIGVVQVEVAIRDSNDSVVSSVIGDANTGFPIDMGGHIVKPGWDIHQTVTQNDSNSYTVSINPLIRKPAPDSPKTTNAPGVIDSFEDGDISEYSGDTGAFTVSSSDAYHGDNSLQQTGGDEKNIRSTSLPNEPSKGDTFSFRVKGTSHTAKNRATMKFGLQDANNFYGARVNFDDAKIFVQETASGSTDTIAESSYAEVPVGEWCRMEVVWNDSVTVRVFAEDGTQINSVIADVSEFTKSHTSGGIGWFVDNATGERIRLDRAVNETA